MWRLATSGGKAGARYRSERPQVCVTEPDTCTHGSIMLPWTMTNPAPAHSLAGMRAKIRFGHCQITRYAQDDAAQLGFDEEDIKECISALTPEEFHKTVISDVVEGDLLDVYKTVFCGKAIYTKLTLGVARKTVVISFHSDTSPKGLAGEKP